MVDVFCLHILHRFAAANVYIERPKFYAKPYAKHHIKYKYEHKHRLANATRANDKINFRIVNCNDKRFWHMNRIKHFIRLFLWHTPAKLYFIMLYFLSYFLVFWRYLAILVHKLMNWTYFEGKPVMDFLKSSLFIHKDNFCWIF